MSGKRKKNTCYSGNQLQQENTMITKIRTIATDVSAFCERHAEALMGIGLGLTIGGVTALYAISKEREEREVTDLWLTFDTDTMEGRGAVTGRSGREYPFKYDYNEGIDV